MTLKPENRLSHILPSFFPHLICCFQFPPFLASLSKEKKKTNFRKGGERENDDAIPKRGKIRKNSFSHIIFARAVCLEGALLFNFFYIMAPNPFLSRKRKTVFDRPHFEIAIAYRLFLLIVCRRTALSMI